MSQLHRGQDWDFTWFLLKGKQRKRRKERQRIKTKWSKTKKHSRQSHKAIHVLVCVCVCGFRKKERFRSRRVRLSLRDYVLGIRWGAVKIRGTTRSSKSVFSLFLSLSPSQSVCLSSSRCFLPTFALSTLSLSEASLRSRCARKSLADTRHGLLHLSQSEEVIKKTEGCWCWYARKATKGKKVRRTNESRFLGWSVGTVRNVNSKPKWTNANVWGQSASNVFWISFSICLLFYFLPFVSSSFFRSLSTCYILLILSLISTLHILVVVHSRLHEGGGDGQGGEG